MLKKDLFVSLPGDFPWGFLLAGWQVCSALRVRKALCSFSKGDVSVIWIKI